MAGDNDDPMLLAEGPMNVGGNYRVSVTWMPSFTNIDEVNMEFEYIVTPVAEEPVTPPTQAPAPTPSPSLNVTALRDMVTEGLESVQGLTFKLARTNATADIIGDLEAIQNTLQNLQGNLTGVTPISQGDVLQDDAAGTAMTSQPQPQQEDQRTSPQSGQPVF